MNEYATKVFAQGRDDPWKGGKKLSHKTVFAPSDVITDGSGNVIEMPLLLEKWCFGLPQVFIRQIGRKKILKRYGKPIEVNGSRCSNCKITQACGALVQERISSSASILATVLAWQDFCRSYSNGSLAFTGAQGRYWQGVLQAIADHGPWTSSNDENVREHRIAEIIKQRESEALKKRRQREEARDLRRLLQNPIEKDYVMRALVERDERRELLMPLLGQPNHHPSISKVRPVDAKRTAEITANVWLVDQLLTEMDRPSNPSSIARYLIGAGLARGRSYESLRQRIPNDQHRIRILESGSPPVWPKFDPDSDLDDNLSEIDELLRHMAL